jgi:hypothetical protein
LGSFCYSAFAGRYDIQELLWKIIWVFFGQGLYKKQTRTLVQSRFLGGLLAVTDLAVKSKLESRIALKALGQDQSNLIDFSLIRWAHKKR